MRWAWSLLLCPSSALAAGPPASGTAVASGTAASGTVEDDSEAPADGSDPSEEPESSAPTASDLDALVEASEDVNGQPDPRPESDPRRFSGPTEPTEQPRPEPLPVEVELPEVAEEPPPMLRRERRRKEKEYRKHRVLPIPVLRSEPGVGFTAGVRGRYNYRLPDEHLSRVQLDVVARASVNRVQQYQFRLRMRNLFEREEVLDVNFELQDDPVFTFVGIANQQFINNRRIQNPMYEADRFSVGPDLNSQFLIKHWEPDEWFGTTPGYLRWFVGWRFQYDRFDADADSLLAEQFPEALGETSRATYYGGLAWDSRDNDYSPTQGSFHDVSLGTAGPWAGGTERFGRVNASLRSYRRMGTKKVILAGQLLFDYLYGDVPLVSKGEFSGLVYREGVGGLDTGRGYFRRRFIGDLKVYSSAELRIEPYEFQVFRWTLTPGIKPFMDAGVVWDERQQGATGVHVSGGMGLYFIWDRFEVLRVDGGISPEGVFLVMSANHAF